MLKQSPKTSIILLLLVLSGCNTVINDNNWPSDIPSKKVFVDGYLNNRNIGSADPKVLDTHLSWIVRFYKGTVLYPNGWNRVSERFLASIDTAKNKKEMATRLRSLGVSIANEWAQDNNVRKINSANVAVWGSALRTSAERNDQQDYISKIEQDVKALIDGTLRANEISYERYYQSEDYDNF